MHVLNRGGWAFGVGQTCSPAGKFALNDERVGILYGNHIDLAAEAIGNKARELLVSLHTFAGSNIYTASLS